MDTLQENYQRVKRGWARANSYPLSDAGPAGGPGPDLASNEEVKHGSALEPRRWSIRCARAVSGYMIGPQLRSEAEAEPKKNFMNNTKSFFDKLIYKIKF
jgi:hypothetical protein